MFCHRLYPRPWTVELAETVTYYVSAFVHFKKAVKDNLKTENARTGSSCRVCLEGVTNSEPLHAEDVLGGR